MDTKELSWADIKEMYAETDRRFKETDLQFKETDRRFKETDRKFKELGLNIAGISNSNGAFAEEYFYSSLEKSMMFAGIHFDTVDNHFKRSIKAPSGEIIKDQFDIVMINDNAVAIIEVRYKAREDYPQKMAMQKVPNFRALFPDYKDFKIYLGLGSMSFEENVVDKARELGIGLLRQVGETIEYETEWVRAY